jgi:hypothetical protein
LHDSLALEGNSKATLFEYLWTLKSGLEDVKKKRFKATFVSHDKTQEVRIAIKGKPSKAFFQSSDSKKNKREERKTALNILDPAFAPIGMSDIELKRLKHKQDALVRAIRLVD